MSDTPAVLVLILNADRREQVRQRLSELDVTAVLVRANDAIDAVERLRPISVVIDEAHAATAPDDFLETACMHHVRLVALPDYELLSDTRDAALRYAAAPLPRL